MSLCVFEDNNKVVVTMIINKDNTGIATNCTSELKRDCIGLKKYFEIEDLGTKNWLMGMSILRDDRK